MANYPFSRDVEKELRQLAREEASAAVQKSVWAAAGIGFILLLLFWLF